MVGAAWGLPKKRQKAGTAPACWAPMCARPSPHHSIASSQRPLPEKRGRTWRGECEPTWSRGAGAELGMGLTAGLQARDTPPGISCRTPQQSVGTQWLSVLLPARSPGRVPAQRSPTGHVPVPRPALPPCHAPATWDESTALPSSPNRQALREIHGADSLCQPGDGLGADRRRARSEGLLRAGGQALSVV